MNNKSKICDNTKIFRTPHIIVPFVLIVLVSSIFVFSLVSLVYLTGISSHFDVSPGPVLSSDDFPETVPMSSPPTVPDGSTYCGACSGCGEFHFIWDSDYIGHSDDHADVLYDDYMECDH